jgi:DNA-binding transcriptional regulator LsrR (DeoR family)
VKANPDHLRLLTKIALMYHEEKLTQPQIAQRLHIAQARVSRLLKQAEETGIVRTTVIPPAGFFIEWERLLEEAYGLDDVVIAESVDGHLTAVLGAAAARYLDASLWGEDRVGLSSWSASLLATIDAMRTRPRQAATKIVQLIGGSGNPAAQGSASRLLSRFADFTSAEPLFLNAPGIAASMEARDALLTDEYISMVAQEWDDVTTALVGIGTLDPSELLAESGNALSEGDRVELEAAGAVGDVCLRYFDAEGVPVSSPLDDRIVGIPTDVLRKVPRRIGVAGGLRKVDAIRGAISGNWVNVLVTDSDVAAQLVSEISQTAKIG